MNLRRCIAFVLVFLVITLTASVFLPQIDQPRVIAAMFAWIALVLFLYWDDGRSISVDDGGEL